MTQLESFEKMKEVCQKNDEFIVSNFLADQSSTFRIFISFSIPELQEEFMLPIHEDHTIIPTIIEQRCVYFTSDHKFRLGKNYQEELISLDLSKSIKDLIVFSELKKTMENSKSTKTIKNMRIIFCTHCKAKSVFNSLKHKCPFCEKNNLNYSEEGDFIFQEYKSD